MHTFQQLTPRMINYYTEDLSQRLQSMYLGLSERPNDASRSNKRRHQCGGTRMDGKRCRWVKSLVLHAGQNYHCRWHRNQDQNSPKGVRCIARQTKDNERCRATYYHQQVPEEDQLTFRCETHKNFAKEKTFRIGVGSDLSLYLLARPTETGASSLLFQAPCNLL